MTADMFASFQDQSFDRKGTFVGTVNYLAPEMIKECEASCASDLWALGCIIFKMNRDWQSPITINKLLIIFEGRQKHEDVRK
jgi:serine/threonine protein kinase